ncbi:MAG: hypothetical protein Q8P44_06280 [Dehalococcoidia bacterium]|nr:hypothetical protein [Dehalococcoidia bacterium]
MKKSKGSLRLAGMALFLGISVALAGGCGVPKADYAELQGKLAAKEKEATALQEQLKNENLLLSTVPNAPPRAPRPTPKPGDPPPPPPPTPPPVTMVPVFFYVDTVTAGAGESKYNVDASRYCQINSSFKRGMHIVWRMKAVDTSNGLILQAADVASATLKLPHGEDIKFGFGRHGTTDDVWFWTAAWDVPPDYPLGALPFTVTLTTKDGKTGTFKQIPVSAPERGIESRLNIVE